MYPKRSNVATTRTIANSPAKIRSDGYDDGSDDMYNNNDDDDNNHFWIAFVYLALVRAHDGIMICNITASVLKRIALPSG